MACENSERMLHAYFDGELDLVRSLEFEEHLKTCPQCASELREQQSLRDSLRAGNLYERAPDGLRSRLRAALPAEVRPQSISTSRRPVIEWLAIADQAQAVVDDVERIRNHPLVPKSIPIYDFVYDVGSGSLLEVESATSVGKAA